MARENGLSADLIGFIRHRYGQDSVPLHQPTFAGREKELLGQCIDSTFVSSVGPFVSEFEQRLARFCQCEDAVTTVNGTGALHLALICAGVAAGDLVITQSATFVATANAVTYCGATPVFVDCDLPRGGMSPEALEAYLEAHVVHDTQGTPRHKATGQRCAACLPVHTLGHPASTQRIAELCATFAIPLVEDAAEALGSSDPSGHVGRHGSFAVLSFNGNKIISTGGGGAVLCARDSAVRARHLSTTAKLPHSWRFDHDAVGFNYRMPNVNAALGVAQLEQLPMFLEAKRRLAQEYAAFFDNHDEVEFITEPEGCRSNYWLNAVLCAHGAQRDALLEATHAAGIGTRPLWTPMHRLGIYAHCPRGPLPHTELLAERLLKLPSGVPHVPFPQPKVQP